ncbi:MAG: FCD domain-containing protein [Planctomycetota bacterium]
MRRIEGFPVIAHHVHKKRDGDGLIGKVTEGIRSEIIHRGLKQGDHIGTEGDLERRLGISRNIVREAVARLRALGVVRSLRGKGLIVAMPDMARIVENGLSFTAPTQIGLRELSELRYVFEMGIVDLAVVRATDEQIARLVALGEQDAALAVRAPLSPDDCRKSLKITEAFHLVILEASGSEPARSLGAVIHAYFVRLMKEVPDFSSRPPGIRAEYLREHRALARTFVKRDVHAARTVLSKMMRRMVRRVRGLPDQGPIPPPLHPSDPIEVRPLPPARARVSQTL